LRQTLQPGTAHSAKSRIKYQRYIGSDNDYVLKKLQPATEPQSDVVFALEQTARLYTQIGETELAHHYRRLAAQDVRSLAVEDIVEARN
jgi:hypothetical protein